MTVTIFRSTDPGSPVFTGEVGKLPALLDACGITGYGSQPSKGWIKVYAGTNQAAYQSGSGGPILWVDDSGPGAAGAQEARIQACESMPSPPTQVNTFPPTSAMPNGVFVRKSETADSTARRWVLAMSEKTIFFLVDSGATNNNGLPVAYGFGFGPSVSESSTDAYNYFLLGRLTEATNSRAGANESFNFLQANFFSTPGNAGSYIQRSLDGTTIGVPVGKVPDQATIGGASQAGTSGEKGPTLPAGALTYSPLQICDAIGSFRGTFPGLWAPLTQRAMNHHDQFSDAAAGRTFEAINCGDTGQLYLETSATWT